MESSFAQHERGFSGADGAERPQNLLYSLGFSASSDGKLVQVATPLELITRPATPWVADFLGQGDLGLKALALQTVASRMQRVAAVPAAVIGAPSDVFANVGERDGATVAVTASLREAVSLMAQHQVSRLQVVDAQGGHVGQLHISDVVAP